MTSPRNPLLTVDTIIECPHGIVLIQRRNLPYGWALPGGFVDYGESLEAAAVREAREETGLNIRLIELMHAYSDPKRDSRGHTVSAVFIAEADGLPHGQDDALQAAVFTAVTLPSPLVFDHGKILSDYFRYRRGTPRDKIFGYHIA